MQLANTNKELVQYRPESQRAAAMQAQISEREELIKKLKADIVEHEAMHDRQITLEEQSKNLREAHFRERERKLRGSQKAFERKLEQTQRAHKEIRCHKGEIIVPEHIKMVLEKRHADACQEVRRQVEMECNQMFEAAVQEKKSQIEMEFARKYEDAQKRIKQLETCPWKTAPSQLRATWTKSFRKRAVRMRAKPSPATRTRCSGRCSLLQTPRLT